MKAHRLRLALAVALALALLVFLAVRLLGYWLEGAGGRQAVEQALAERIGLPVRLEGAFEVMLLPAIGVSGTGLVVGGPVPGGELARGGEYSVSLALGPLIERRLSIESVRLEGGVLYTQRWPERDQPQRAADGGAPPPEIGRLEVRNFRLLTGAGPDQGIWVSEFVIEDFAARRDTPFRLDVRELGTLTGSFRWEERPAFLQVSALWSGPWPGTVTLRAESSLATGVGALAATWAPDGPAAPAPARDASLSLDYVWTEEGVRLGSIRLSYGRQSIEGAGCLRAGANTTLDLDLSAESLDLDDLPDLPALGGTARPDRPDTGDGVLFNIRLVAGEVRKSGATARQAVLRLGNDPDCGALGGRQESPAESAGMPEAADPIQ